MAARFTAAGDPVARGLRRQPRSRALRPSCFETRGQRALHVRPLQRGRRPAVRRHAAAAPSDPERDAVPPAARSRAASPRRKDIVPGARLHRPAPRRVPVRRDPAPRSRAFRARACARPSRTASRSCRAAARSSSTQSPRDRSSRRFASTHRGREAPHLRAARARGRGHARPTLAKFLEETGRELEDVYNAGGWTTLQRGSGLSRRSPTAKTRTTSTSLSRRLGSSSTSTSRNACAVPRRSSRPRSPASRTHGPITHAAAC